MKKLLLSLMLAGAVSVELNTWDAHSPFQGPAYVKEKKKQHQKENEEKNQEMTRVMKERSHQAKQIEADRNRLQKESEENRKQLEAAKQRKPELDALIRQAFESNEISWDILFKLQELVQENKEISRDSKYFLKLRLKSFLIHSRTLQDFICQMQDGLRGIQNSIPMFSHRPILESLKEQEKTLLDIADLFENHSKTIK